MVVWLLIPLGTLGCGSDEFETAKVVGTVTIDGKPLTQGSVIFQPEQGWPGRGEIDSQGQFVLSTYGEQDGAIVGEHQVAVIAETGDENVPFEGRPTEPIRSLIPTRYSNKATSGLRFDVESGVKNEVELKLTSDPKGS